MLPSSARACVLLGALGATFQLFLACSSTSRQFSPERGAGSAAGAEANEGPNGNASKGGSGARTDHASGGNSDGGDGASSACITGETEPCWETPAGVPLDGDPASLSGNCRAGVRTCSESGAWGACDGAVAPLDADDCSPGDDSNCNGVANEGCTCSDGDQRSCGTDQGNCKKGIQTCQGSTWSPCKDQVAAKTQDSCVSGDDANCNGIPNEGCLCIDGATRTCGIGVGNCKQGTQSCVDGVWQECEGNIDPTGQDSCEPGDDSNCDGIANEGCPCIDGAEQECGSDVGNCKKGKRKCVGGAWGACSGNVAPKANDSCDEGDDATCNGVPNEGCLCVNGHTRACGSNVGNCRQGVQTCSAGVWSGACVGEVKPAAKDLCTPGDDSNCNGNPNEGCSCVIGKTQACGKCGSQTCSASGWGVCMNEGVCTPNDVDEQVEQCQGGCTNHKRKRTCSNSCSWGSWGNWDSACQYESHASKTCFSSDVYWQDSCGNIGSKVQECNTASCDHGACFRDCSGVLTFDDPKLEEMVRLAIEKSDGSPIYGSDVQEKPTGIVPDSYNISGITSLGGIECLPAIEVIDVGGHPVADASPVRNLQHLWYAGFWSTEISDLKPFADNPHITHLDVTGTRIDCNTQQQYLTAIANRPADVIDDCH